MLKSSEGIILEDCLISFILLSTFLILMSAYMSCILELKSDINEARGNVNELKTCMLQSCPKSSGNTVKRECVTIEVKSKSKEVCVEI